MRLTLPLPLRLALTRVRGALRRRHGDEDGSTLIMYPFALLIVIGLGGIALDTAVFFQAHRQTIDVAAGLASDIAGVVDQARFAAGEGVRIDPDVALQMTTLTNNDLAGHPHGLACGAQLDVDATSVTVTCTGRAVALLMPVMGGFGTFDMVGTSTASPG